MARALKWLQSMLPIPTRYRKAIGKDIGEDEQKRVWKLHFARQITIAEQTTIITFRFTHLEITEMRKIENLINRKFDEQVLQKLFTRLSNSLPTYSPDKSVMDYLNQHSSSLHWEKKLDFRTPREKQSQDTRPSKHEKRKDHPDKRADRPKERAGRTHERSKRPDRASDRKRPKTSRSDTSSKHRIPKSEQCRRPTCMERGNHLNHSHAKCRFADTSTRHPNLGKAPAKKTKPASSSSGGKNARTTHHFKEQISPPRKQRAQQRPAKNDYATSVPAKTTSRTLAPKRSKTNRELGKPSQRIGISWPYGTKNSSLRRRNNVPTES
jgi:hypothetical protein